MSLAQAINVYELISNIYGQAVQSLEDAFDGIFFALQNVVEVGDADIKVELLASFRDTYNRFDNKRYAALAAAAKKLNEYTLTASQQSDINSFLEISNIQVSSNWAKLSAIAGYVIDPIYIQ